MKKIIIILCLMVISTLLTYGADEGVVNNNGNNVENGGDWGGIFPPDFTFPEGEIPAIPVFPSIPSTGKDVSENGEIRLLEKTFTVMLESKVNVFVPLEVITDIDIEGSVIGDQIIDIPFEIELNREPEKKDYYSIKYSENLLDIDNDGLMDTYIHSPEFVNERVSKDNFVRVYGENISKEGTYKKDIYITVEVGN